jgi:hypothetical protein
MTPSETLSDDEAWDDDVDCATEQYGAKWEDLHESDQRLISMSESREAYDAKAPASLPQPARASSVRGLPKVKSGAFPRLIR